MAETHGFTKRILGDDGKPTTVVFSSVRRTPALLGILKSIHAAQKRYDRTVLDRGVWRSRIQSIANADVPMTKDSSGADVAGSDPYADDAAFDALRSRLDEAAAKFETASDAIEEINVELCELTYQFYLAGFKGAGYTDELAEKYAAGCDPTDLQTYRDHALTGCGVVDFTKRDTI